MTTLLMVHHGQAVGHARGHDGLSWRGIVQARKVGAWLARMQRPVSAVWCGPHRAQVDTARHMVDATGEAGRRAPAPILRDELTDLPAVLPLDAWAAGQLDAGAAVESFAHCEARLRRALGALAEDASPDACVVMVTSAGVTALAVQIALGLYPDHFARLAGAVLNGSLTELSISPDRAELLTFNAVGHLAREELSSAGRDLLSASL